MVASDHEFRFRSVVLHWTALLQTTVCRGARSYIMTFEVSGEGKRQRRAEVIIVRPVFYTRFRGRCSNQAKLINSSTPA
jgi:hypothetical protein